MPPKRAAKKTGLHGFGSSSGGRSLPIKKTEAVKRNKAPKTGIHRLSDVLANVCSEKSKATVEDEDYLNIENAADKDDQTTDENADEMSEAESEEEAKDMEDGNSISAVEQEKLAREDRDGKLRANRLRHAKIQNRILVRATMDALHTKALSDKDLKPYVMQEVPGDSFVLHGIERGKKIFKLDRAKGIYWIRKNQSIKDPTKGDFIQTTGRLSNDPRDAEYPTLYKSLKNPRHLAIEYAEKLQKLVDTEEDSETSEDEDDAESDSEDDDEEEEGEEEEKKEKEGSET